MSLHRTPTHHKALRLVFDGEVGYRNHTDSGGAAPVGTRFVSWPSGAPVEADVNTALYELVYALLISVHSGQTFTKVTLTPEGACRLAAWNTTRVVG